MKLSELMRGHADIPAANDAEITALTTDSRAVEAGAAFVAVIGAQCDGRDFIADALKKGAAAVIYEDPEGDTPLPTNTNVPMLGVAKLQQKLSQIASRFYGEPGKALIVIGITGTNGKSSVAFFLAQALKKLGVDAAMIGTIGTGRPQALVSSSMTTPDAIALQATLRALVDQGVKAVCMEVSSHGLDQARVAAVPLQTAVFTNLSQDHLDYHGDMAAYAAVKRGLFDFPGIRHRVINIDDATGARWFAEFAQQDALSYGVNKKAGLRISALKSRVAGLSFKLTTEAGSEVVNTSLLGEFNAWNLAAAGACLLGMGFSLAEIAPVLAQIKAPAGRMQRIGLSNQAGLPAVVVDYAHTPDALEKALQSLRKHSNGRLSVVFGCGGDRDVDKRPKMGAIAEALADQVIVTDDNPRSESPQAITRDVLAGMKARPGVRPIVIHDRKQAVCEAIITAAADDWVLIAGKGHENTQIMGEQLLPFDDCKVAESCLRQLREAA